MNNLDAHYDYDKQQALKDAAYRLSHIKKSAEKGDIYMNKLLHQKKETYHNIGELKKKEVEYLKQLKQYLKSDKEKNHKKDLAKIEKAITQNKEYLSW